MPPPVLPPEMISEILAGVNDKADLLALRLTSREFRRLATRKAFRCITVTPTTSSAQNLMKLQGCDELAKYVQEIRFNGDIIYEDVDSISTTSGTESAGRSGSQHDSDSAPESLNNQSLSLDESFLDEEGLDEDFKEALKSLRAAFSGLAKFPALATLVLNFSCDYVDVEEDYGFKVFPRDSFLLQVGILQAISDFPVDILSLSLHNLLPYEQFGNATSSFHDFMKPVRHLSVSVLSDVEDNWEGECDAVPMWCCWNEITEHILTPAENLESLSLISHLEHGLLSQDCLDDLHLSNLKHLSLTRLTFDYHDEYATTRKVILNHKATLTHLELHSCAMHVWNYPEDPLETPRHWSSLYTLFEEEMCELVSFVLVGNDPNPHQAGYCMMGRKMGYIILTEDIVEAHREDEEALGSFRAVVNARRRLQA